MSSSESRIYLGIARDPNTFGVADAADPAKLVVTTSHPAQYTRKVSVYVPKQYAASSIAPFLVRADGPDQLVFSTLDSLIAERKIPVMIAIAQAALLEAKHRKSTGNARDKRLSAFGRWGTSGLSTTRKLEVPMNYLLKNQVLIPFQSKTQNDERAEAASSA